MKTTVSTISVTSMARGQGGAVLIVSLIFLLLMTLVGVASMQGTTLQERMAGNMRDRDLALQAAEAALRAGEAWIEVASNKSTADSATPLEELIASGLLRDWDGSTPSGTLAGFTPELATNPVFYVQPSQQVIYGVTATSMTVEDFYPVTARGVGSTGTSIVILQTMFKRLD
jgi:type IV pilus assembly protein PilX